MISRFWMLIYEAVNSVSGFFHLRAVVAVER